MIWLLAILVSCITISAEKCEVTLQPGKVFHPKTSLQNGAIFRSHLSVPARWRCQQGCCDDENCDTILFTGNKADKNGNNCFLFQCNDHCTLKDAVGEELAFQVVSVSRLLPDDDLPDFSDIFSTTKPEPVQDAATPDENIKSPVHEVSEEPNVSKQNITSVKDDDIAKVESTPEEPSDIATVPKGEESEPIPSTETSNTETAIQPAVNATQQPTQPKSTESSSDSEQSVTVKDNEEKPVEKEESVESQPDTYTETKEDATEKPSLPNEVPVVNPVVPNNTTEITPAEPETNKPDQAPESDSESEIKADEPEVDKPAEIDEESKDTSVTTDPDTKLSVEVEVENTIKTTTTSNGYMNNKLMFWGVVAVGATMIVFGLTVVIRYYANKRRRLYSSLTDDYLINGMYSI